MHYVNLLLHPLDTPHVEQYILHVIAVCYKYKWCLSIIFLLMPMFTDVLTSSVMFVCLCFTLQFFLKEHWVCLSSAADISLYSNWYADLPGGRVEREVHHNAFPTPGDGQLATLRLKHHCGIYIFYTRQYMFSHRCFIHQAAQSVQL